MFYLWETDGLERDSIWLKNYFNVFELIDGNSDWD